MTKKAFICSSSNAPLDREVNLCYQCGRKWLFLFIELLTLHSELKQNSALTVWHSSSKQKVIINVGDLHVSSLLSYEKNWINEKLRC